MLYLQAGLLVIAAIALLAVLIGAVKNVHGPRKGKYRYSWFEKKR
jgi:hypothetical protein